MDIAPEIDKLQVPVNEVRNFVLRFYEKEKPSQLTAFSFYLLPAGANPLPVAL
jgi:hypothetical protein